MREKLKGVWIIAIPIFLLCVSATPALSDEVTLDETVIVDAQGYRSWFFRFEYEGAKMRIEMEVIKGNDINLFVLDDDDFDLWASGKKVEALVEEEYLVKERIGSLRTTITLGPPDKYWVVLDNEYSSITDKSVYIKLTHVISVVEAPTGGIAGLAWISMVLGLFAFLRVRKKRKF